MSIAIKAYFRNKLFVEFTARLTRSFKLNSVKEPEI